MPKITELDSVISLDGNDVLPIVSKNNNNEDETMKIAVNAIGTKLLNSNEYGALDTTDKKIIGAINEVNGKAKDTLSDLTDTTIATPSNADLLAYDSGSSKWVNTDLKGSATGSIATFSNGGDGIPCAVECEIKPVQSGSGTPSPSNPRPISGVSNLDISVADGDMVVQHTHTLALGETIYGGVARNDGTGNKTLNYIEFDGSGDENWQVNTGLTNVYYISLSNINKPDGIVISDKFVQTDVPGASMVSGQMKLSYLNLNFKNDNITSLADWKTWLANNPLQIVAELATPQALSFTGEKIPTLSGNNNIYHNGNGDISVDYFTDKADNLADLIKAFL